MTALSTSQKPHPCLRRNVACAAAALGLVGAASLHAQTASASGPQPGASFTHTDTQQDSDSSRTRSAAAPFTIPHSITKTTASGVKFQFTPPRVGFRAGDAPMSRISPLDSNGTQFTGARSNSIFPTDNSFLQPTGTSSDSMFGSSTDGLADLPRSGPGGTGRRGAGGGPGLDVKSSTFDFHVGLSMKDMMAGSFSQNGSQNGGGSASPNSGFGISGSSANDFGTTGGVHTPGSGGNGGGGAKLSLGLRF